MSPANEFRFSPGEWHLFQSAFNEVTHGLRIADHTSVLGVTKEDLELFLHRLRDLPRDTELTVEASWLPVARNALRETLEQLGYWDFRTRTGYSIEEAQTVL